VARRVEGDEPLHRGIHTRRQGVFLRCETFLIAAEASGRLVHIAEFARDVFTRLRVLWPDVPDVPLYPAFAGRG
jgi:hypothetical protein